jgi:hypothetical protein
MKTLPLPLVAALGFLTATLAASDYKADFAKLKKDVPKDTKEKNLAWVLITGRIRLRGSPKWLLAFGRCFPS